MSHSRYSADDVFWKLGFTQRLLFYSGPRFFLRNIFLGYSVKSWPSEWPLRGSTWFDKRNETPAFSTEIVGSPKKGRLSNSYWFKLGMGARGCAPLAFLRPILKNFPIFSRKSLLSSFHNQLFHTELLRTTFAIYLDFFGLFDLFSGLFLGLFAWLNWYMSIF